MSTAITTQALSKSFFSGTKSVQALKPIDLEIETGELFGLFGANGAGKTTLVHLLTTLLAPSGGDAWVGGLDIRRQAKQIRSQIGLATAKENSFYGQLNLYQNLFFFAGLQNMGWRQIPQAINQALDLFDLLPLAKRPVQSLSSGQRQKLNLARALVHDPPILFFDEPTRSMDIQSRERFKALLKNYLVTEKRKTVIYISHDFYEMDDFCNRVAILSGGELRAIGDPLSLRSQIKRAVIYRIKVVGMQAEVLESWQKIKGLKQIQTISSGQTLSVYDLELHEDSFDQTWFALVSAVHQYGGRVVAFSENNEVSLHQIVRYFSQESDAPH